MDASLTRQVADLTTATRRTRDEVRTLLEAMAAASDGPAGAAVVAGCLQTQRAVTEAVGEVLDRQLALITALRAALAPAYDEAAPISPLRPTRRPRRGLAIVSSPPETAG